MINSKKIRQKKEANLLRSASPIFNFSILN